MSDERRDGSTARSETEGPGGRAGEAERIAEDWAERTWRWVLGAAARAREEAEDIWAEAQDLRRKL